MAHEARMACLVQRHDHWDASALLAKDAFAMATTGSQDWAVWDLDDIRMNPVGKDNERHISNLIYNGGNCLDLWIDGNPIMQSGIVNTINEKSLLEEFNTCVENYYNFE